MVKIPKWGFGTAPFKEKTDYKNKRALNQVKRFIDGNKIAENINITDEISCVKGIFNRIIKQDQWDWFTTYMYLDYPSIKECKKIVQLLTKLRAEILSNNNKYTEQVIDSLKLTNICIYI